VPDTKARPSLAGLITIDGNANQSEVHKAVVLRRGKQLRQGDFAGAGAAVGDLEQELDFLAGL
jgi:hypothetical protein